MPRQEVGKAGQAGLRESGDGISDRDWWVALLSGKPDRTVGGCKPVDEELGENYSHPSSEESEECEESETSDVGEGERVLLSLRHANPQLHLGVREARGLAEVAAEWIRRGVSAADSRRALTSELPKDGVRSAVGFLRHQLVQKLPAPVAAPAPPVMPSPVRELVVCEGEGEEHVFRPVGDEALCGPCAREANRAFLAARRAETENEPDPLPWRERIAAINESEQGLGRGQGIKPSEVLAATRASGSVRDTATGS
ncbi:hypothetical protein ACIP4W_06405 [Streptomyces sp. NPDC088846]|uniref:hypothetical protein n=1 Tax=Streptomyces sp. NPDC088846 TaxID=3365908 RepID=UPI003830C77D